MCSQGMTFSTAPKRRIMSSVMSNGFEVRKRIRGEALDLGGPLEQSAEPPLAEVLAVGVDVLTEEA